MAFKIMMKKKGTGAAGSIPDGALLMENGDPILTESGDYIILE